MGQKLMEIWNSVAFDREKITHFFTQIIIDTSKINLSHCDTVYKVLECYLSEALKMADSKRPGSPGRCPKSFIT